MGSSNKSVSQNVRSYYSDIFSNFVKHVRIYKELHVPFKESVIFNFKTARIC